MSVFIIDSACNAVYYITKMHFHTLYSVSACPVVLQKDEGSDDDVDDTLTEEKHASDLDNESEQVSGEEEFTEEERSPGTEAAAGSAEQSTATSVRKRKPQGPSSPEAT